MGQGVSVDHTLTRANVDPPRELLYPPTSVDPRHDRPGLGGGATTKWPREAVAELSGPPALL